MKKDDLISEVYTQLGALNKADVACAVSKIFDIMKDKLVAGEAVRISGFGVFNVRDKNQRIGRNPKTGQEAIISARRVVTFHPSPVMRAKINTDLNTSLKEYEDSEELD